MLNINQKWVRHNIIERFHLNASTAVLITVTLYYWLLHFSLSASLDWVDYWSRQRGGKTEWPQECLRCACCHCPQLVPLMQASDWHLHAVPSISQLAGNIAVTHTHTHTRTQFTLTNRHAIILSCIRPTWQFQGKQP